MAASQAPRGVIWRSTRTRLGEPLGARWACCRPSAFGIRSSLRRSLCPGIIYVAFLVQNFDESIAFFESKGVTVLDDASAAVALGLGSARISPTSHAKSRFVADVDGNFIRLVGA